MSTRAAPRLGSHAAELSLALSLPLWNRLARRRLRSVFSRWKRRVRLISAQTNWTRLVAEQRRYQLRKLVLQVYWQSVALAFERWRCVIRSFNRVARCMAMWRRSQLTRLAWTKWQRLVRAERLSEETAACQCVMWTRRADRLVARAAARGDSERLIVFWLAWKNWYRRERCKAWRRGISMAARKYFVAWQRYHAVARAHRALVEAMARDVVGSLLNDCFEQCLWRRNLRDLQRTDAVLLVQGVLQRLSARIQRQRLAHAFVTWQSLLASTGDVTHKEAESPPAPLLKAPSFPERFSAAYRKQKLAASTKPTRAYRRSWR